MISFVFGVRVVMAANGTFSPSLSTYLGNITGLTDINRLRVEASTTTGNKVTLRGDFDFNNAGDLRGSDVTGFDVRTPRGALLVSVQGIPDTEFEDLDGSAADWLGQINKAMRQGFTLSSGATADLVIGLGGNDTFVTGAGNDVLRGGAGNDRLTAGLGNDKLDGGLGIDIMNGGAGNDRYTVDNLKDRVIEGTNGGLDTVTSSDHWTMANGVEKLAFTGTRGLRGIGNALGNTITGNAGANVLEGRAGNDILNGKTGADIMRGGLGNDTYFVDRATDKAVELAGQGNDTVNATTNYTLGANVENLTLLLSGDFDATGNALANRIRGNAGDNVIAGLGGADVLIGGLGADKFAFAHTGANADDITDFVSGTDSLWLDPTVFSALTAGNLDATQFRDSSILADGNDFLVYDQASGVLSYDANGDGITLVEIVDLGTSTVLSAADIHVAVA
ncbi:MAG: calcium-binding protein [Gammaproteobacteria bacterium]